MKKTGILGSYQGGAVRQIAKIITSYSSYCNRQLSDECVQWYSYAVPRHRMACNTHITTGSTWAYDIKRNKNGTLARFKALLYAQGFSQGPGVDYTFVLEHTSA